MSENPDTTPPPPSSITSSSTGTSVSSMTRNSKNRYGGNGGRRNNCGPRINNTIITTKTEDESFIVADDSYGVVMGVPSELPHLKHGASFNIFLHKIRDKITSKLDYGHQLLPVFNEMKNPVTDSDFKKLPAKDPDIEDTDEQLLVQKYKVQEWKKAQLYLKNDLKTAYVAIWGQCTHTLQGVIQSDPQWQYKDGERDPVWLLETIKKILTGVNLNRNKMRTYF